jgi:hypothetical protein
MCAIMSCKSKKYEYKGVKMSEKDLVRFLSQKQSVVNAYKAQEERIGADYQLEDRLTFEKKTAALQKTMNVEVVYDDTVSTSRLLGKNDPRTKAAGKPVIVINPNQMYKTTAIHEFGHVFIDSFPGGFQNKRIQKAIDELRGTDLWAEISQLYPELSQEMLEKEILVTAIGIKGSEIWDSNEKASMWEAFLAWFNDYLKRTFGLKRSEVMALSRDLLSNKVKEINVEMLEEIDQQMKITLNEKSLLKAETSSKFDLQIKKTNDSYNTLLGTVTKILKNQKEISQGTPAKARIERNKSEALKEQGDGKLTRLESIKDLEKALKEFEAADKAQGFMKYLSWSLGQLQYMQNTLNNDSIFDSTDKDRLEKSFNWLASFNVVDEAQIALEELKGTGIMSKEELDTMSQVVKSIQGQKKGIKSTLISNARKSYVVMLADNDVKTDETYKDLIKEEYKEVVEAGSTDLTEGEYVIKELQERKEEIFDKKIEIATERSLNSTTAMGWVSYQILTEKDMKSEDVALISNLLDKASSDWEIYSVQKATEEDAYVKKFNEISSSRNMKKKYSGMFTVSDSGVSYYTGEYSPNFIEKNNELSREQGDSEIHNEMYKDTKVTLEYNSKEEAEYFYTSNIIDPVTGATEKTKLDIYGAKLTIPGMENLKEGERPLHVEYVYKKEEEIHTVTLEEAIARSEYSRWLSLNTAKKTWENDSGITTTGRRPISKWESQEYKDLKLDQTPMGIQKFDELIRFRKDQLASDKMYESKNSLVDNYNAVKFIRLPGVMKEAASRVVEGQSIKTMSKQALSELTQTQADEYDDESGFMVYTDYSEGETLKAPTPYRAKLKENDQSYDLHTIGLLHSIMAKNNQEKSKVQSALVIISEVMKEKNYPQLDGLNNQKIDKQNNLPVTEKGSKSKELQKVFSIAENRLFGITTKDSGSVKILGKEVEVNKLAKSSLKYFGSVALVFNYANSIINLGTGSVSNLIEAVGGDLYDYKDYVAAKKLYGFDLKNIMADMGANVQTSKTNLFMNFFNAMGPNALNVVFEKGSKMEALSNMNSLRPLANMGEHMMQANVMYAVLHSIKVQNKNGTWIDVNGKSTKDKNKAASMVDMITFKKNKKGGQEMVIHPSVKNTSFTTTGKQEDIILETRNLIRSKIDELQGQYTDDIHSHSQRYMLGKMGFFLRKWMIPGYVRRFRGLTNSFKPADKELSEAESFYSQDQKKNMEGYHVSTMRFFAKIINDTREDTFNVVKSWNGLTTSQKSGVKKTAVDVAFMIAVSIAYGLLEGDGDIDDEDVFLAYLLRRQQSELLFFTDPRESFKVAQTPTAAVGNLKNIIKVTNHILPWNWGEKYETGKYKGELKIRHRLKKLVPNVKGTEDFKKGIQFLNTTGGQG